MWALHVWCIENRVHLFKPNVSSVIRVTHSQMNLKLLISSLHLYLTVQHWTTADVFSMKTVLLAALQHTWFDEKHQYFLGDRRSAAAWRPFSIVKQLTSIPVCFCNVWLNHMSLIHFNRQRVHVQKGTRHDCLAENVWKSFYGQPLLLPGEDEHMKWCKWHFG